LEVNKLFESFDRLYIIHMLLNNITENNILQSRKILINNACYLAI